MPRFTLRHTWDLRSCYYCGERHPVKQKNAGGFFILACDFCARRYASIDSPIARVIENDL